MIKRSRRDGQKGSHGVIMALGGAVKPEFNGGQVPGRRVLVVDDEPAIAGLIRAVLTRRGYDVTTSEGGEDALDEASVGSYGLVISDYAIPGMSGLEFARRLGSRQPEVRILIVSAFLDPQTIEELDAEPNVIGLMRKPFDIFNLTEQVVAQLGEPQQSADGFSRIGGGQHGAPHEGQRDGCGAPVRMEEHSAEDGGNLPPAPFLDPGAFH